MQQHPTVHSATNWHDIAELILQALEENGDIIEDRPHALAKVQSQISTALRLRAQQSCERADADHISNIDFGRNDAEFLFRMNEAVDISPINPATSFNRPSMTYSDLR